MGRAHGVSMLPHMRCQEHYQFRSTMEGVEDLGRRRSGGAGEGKGGVVELEEGLIVVVGFVDRPALTSPLLYVWICSP